MDYSYRGVLLDDARHFCGVPAVFELLDVMARLDYNILHWHLSDDQGFRVLLPDYPRLASVTSRRGTNVGGYFKNHPGGPAHEGAYTEDEVRRIAAYARERGIEIMPELDMPGHFSAILTAYPEFACNGDAPTEVPGHFGVHKACLCLSNEEARRFALGLALRLAELCNAKKIHIGFDEIKRDNINSCPRCQTAGGADRLIRDFRLEAARFFTEKGFEVFGWNDGIDAPISDITLMHWRPETNKQTANLANKGQKLVICDFYHYYADYPYCFTPLRKTYRFNPVLRGIKPACRKNVIGVECAVWSEFIPGAERLRFQAYPRLEAIARKNWLGGRPVAEDRNIMNPSPITRIVRLIKCLLKDSTYEYTIWRKHHDKS